MGAAREATADAKALLELGPQTPTKLKLTSNFLNLRTKPGYLAAARFSFARLAPILPGQF